MFFGGVHRSAIWPGLDREGWQFQSDTGAAEWDYPDLVYAQVARDRWGVGGEVLDRLARQQVDLDIPWRSDVGTHYSGNMHRLTAGDGVLSASQSTPCETVPHAPDERPAHIHRFARAKCDHDFGNSRSRVCVGASGANSGDHP